MKSGVRKMTLKGIYNSHSTSNIELDLLKKAHTAKKLRTNYFTAEERWKTP